jgi:uncharacterized protein (TIGR02001 family)
MLPAAPAAAQLGGSVSLFSQARLRGQPISDHRPVAELELVHDSASGFYLGGSAALVADRTNGLQPFAFKQYAGFAHRLSPGATLDLGVVHNGYTEYSGIIGGGSYTEAYIGIIGRNLSGRVFISPGYFRKDQATLYMEVDGHLDLARNWVIVSHLGRLTYLNDDRPAGSPGGVTDWRLGLRRHMGSVDLEAAWTGYADLMVPAMITAERWSSASPWSFEPQEASAAPKRHVGFLSCQVARRRDIFPDEPLD